MGVGVFLQADQLLLTVSWQIYLLSVSQPAHLEETDRKSAGRNGWKGISASRFTDYQLLCQQIWRR